MRLDKAIFLTLFTLLVMAGCTRLYNKTELSAGRIVPLVKKIQPAVVTVVAYDVNLKVSNLGSGFFIDKKGYLITNYHVLKGSYAAKVKTYDGKAYPIELVLAENKSSDLIKVWVNIPDSSIHWITVTETEPSIADRVVVVGSPLGLEQTVSEGIVSAIRDLPVVGKVFQLSAPISQGSSGSPVVNMRGKVVGVVSFQATRGQNLNFAVSSKSVLYLKQSETSKTLSEWTYDIKMRTPKLVEKLCKQGFNFSIRGEFKDALNYFKEATEKSPNNTVAWYGLGSCYDGLDQPEQAIEAFKQVLRINPDHAPTYFYMGMIFNNLEQYDAAVTSYKIALKIKPDSASILYNMGIAYGGLGNSKKEV